MPIYNVDETPLPWPLPQCLRTFKRKKVPGGPKMVKPCWDFFQIPLNKVESKSCPKQMVNQETLASKMGK